MSLLKRDPVSGQYVTDTYRTNVDMVSNKLSYTGKTIKQDAAGSDSVWQISRSVTNGTLTQTEFANKGFFDQVWDNRTTLFPTPSYNNQYSVLLDGINDDVSFGDNFNYNAANQWSISLWFKADNSAARQTLYSKTTADANVYGWGIYYETGGAIFLQVRAAGALRQHTSTATFTPGVWNNLVMTYSGSSDMTGIRLYFNGTVGITPSAGSIGDLLSGQTAMIGTRNGSFPFSGYIDEVGIWSKRLSAAEVAEIYNGGFAVDLLQHSALSNLANYYRLGDGDSGTTALDSSDAVNGTLNNGAAFAVEAP